MKLFIPKLGDKLTLAEDWTFFLYNEGRNSSLINLLAPNNGDNYYSPAKERLRWEAKGWIFPQNFGAIYKQITIPKGVVLGVSRIYIRLGQKDYNSLTFTLDKKSIPSGSWMEKYKKTKGTIRFWAKLEDVNTMEVV